MINRYDLVQLLMKFKLNYLENYIIQQICPRQYS